jgi:hypothetical protein
MASKSKFWIAGAASAMTAGVVGGTFGALISVSNPAPVATHTSIAARPSIIKPGMPIMLYDKGTSHAEVQVDRNGLILLNLTTSTGQNQIALGLLGDSKLELGVFDSTGKAKAGLEVPMKDSERVHLLMLEKPPLQPGVPLPTKS